MIVIKTYESIGKPQLNNFLSIDWICAPLPPLKSERKKENTVGTGAARGRHFVDSGKKRVQNGGRLHHEFSRATLLQD